LIGEVTLLVVVLDINPFVWAERQINLNPSFIKFSNLLEHFLVFVNGYFMLQQHNLLAIISCNVGESQLIFPQLDSASTISDFERVKKKLQIN